MSNSQSVTDPMQRAPGGRKPWQKPRVVRIVTGSAEAVSRDGQPDGGGPGQSRS